METTSILLSSITIFIVVIGWFVNQWLNRRNEIAKEARNFRLEMLKSYLNLIFKMERLNASRESLNDFPEIPPISFWKIVQVKFTAYGINDENKVYKELMELVYRFDFFDRHLSEKADGTQSLLPEDAFELDSRYQNLYEKAKFLENICVNSIRKELKLEKINFKKVNDYDE